MLIKALLIIAAILLFVFFLRRSHTARLQAFKRIGLLLFFIFGVVAVLRPDLMTWLAKQVGVGRGTDLLTYLLVVVFGFFSLNTYLRFKDTERRLTKLARAMAIRDAVAPEAGEPRVVRVDGVDTGDPEANVRAASLGRSGVAH
jgi:hypothetical protein